MSLEVKNQQAGGAGSAGAASGGEGAVSAPAEGGGTAQGSSGSESTEGTPPPGESGEAAAAAEGGEGAAEGGEGGEETPSFKARDKFKVLDQEIEVPDFLKPLIKDAESEKQVIELLEKAHGLEPVKAERAQVRKERDQFKTELTQVKGSIDGLRKIYTRGDLDLFLDTLQIPHEKMLQWALDKVNYSQLPPEQQRALDARTQAERNAYFAEQRAGSYEQQVLEQGRQAKSMLLEAGLASPDVTAFATAYDAKVGKPGAFKAEVVAAGELAWVQSSGKVDLTPQQAIEQAMQKWRPFVQTQSPVATPAAPGAPVVTNAPQSKAATIPNVTGKTSSPMKPKVKSISDLRKLANPASAS